MRLGLTHKIFGGYLVLITLLVGISGYGGVAIYGLMGDYRKLVVEGVPMQRDMGTLAQVFRLQTGNEKKFNVVRNLAFAELFADQNREWEELGHSLARRFAGQPQALAMDDLLAQHRVYARLAVDNMTSGGTPRHDTGILVDMISVGLDDLSKSVRAAQDAKLEETQIRGDHTLGITMALGLFTLAVGLVAALGFATLLTRPVRHLKRATEEVARGIFNRKVPVGAKDEIGDLGAAFNRMAEKLQSLDELREEFIAYVSHELKTPLTSLKEANALLLEELAGPINGRQRQLLDIIAEDGQKIERLVAEMLELSKMEAGMMRFDLRPEPLPDIVTRALTEMSPVAEKHGMVLTMAGEPEILVVADRSRIRQVITNLVSNAIKFSPAGSEVTVGWIENGGEVVCSVSDQGPGVPEEAREMIFEKFHQLAPSALSGMRGTGLGLPIARKIMSAHGGRLWVECPPQGGSIFRFSLPSQPRPVTPPRSAARQAVTG